MYNIPKVTKNLLFINIIVYLATLVLEMRGIDLSNIGGLHFFLASDFHFYQLITYMFLHGSFWHIFGNMFGLWMFGVILERTWGSKRFLFYSILTGIGAGVPQELVQYVNYSINDLSAYATVSTGTSMIPMDAYLNMWTTIGASGAIYAILLAFGMLYPNEKMFIIPIPVPIKAKWFVMGYIAIELVLAQSSPGDGVAHYAHLGGMLFGFLLIRYWRKRDNQFSWGGSGPSFFEQMRNNFQSKGHYRPHMHVEPGKREDEKESDWEFNARKKADQEEIDRILDKIRTSGYDSLTKEEKQKLFDSSKND